MESAVALGLIGEESAADALNNALLNDESAEVRYAALLATMRIGSKKSIDAVPAGKREGDRIPLSRTFSAKWKKRRRSK